MTDAEFATLREQVVSLQQQAERRAKAWRPIGIALYVFAIGYALSALGFFIASAWLDAAHFPSTHRFTETMSFLLLFISIPLGLISQMFRTP
jgi:hypothetical protein